MKIRVLNPKTLKKAGFINGELELTLDGRTALEGILFAANKPAMITAAQEILDEQEKDK